jgi:hypothetical protein
MKNKSKHKKNILNLWKQDGEIKKPAPGDVVSNLRGDQRYVVISVSVNHLNVIKQDGGDTMYRVHITDVMPIVDLNDSPALQELREKLKAYES